MAAGVVCARLQVARAALRISRATQCPLVYRQLTGKHITQRETHETVPYFSQYFVNRWSKDQGQLLPAVLCRLCKSTGVMCVNKEDNVQSKEDNVRPTTKDRRPCKSRDDDAFSSWMLGGCQFECDLCHRRYTSSHCNVAACQGGTRPRSSGIRERRPRQGT